MKKEIFGTYKERPKPDGIIGLTTQFDADPRRFKLDMAIGYLRGENEKIYIPPAIRTASRRSLRIKEGYVIPHEPLGWNGDREFMKGVIRMVLGDSVDELLRENRIAAATTIGGTQAVSLFAEAINKTRLGNSEMPSVIMATPPYPNHPIIFNGAGLSVEYYPQTTHDGKFNIAATLETINHSTKENVVLFQGTAHNPTGINAKTEDEWRTIAQAMKMSQATAFFDFPYAGLDVSIQKDTFPARIFIEEGIPTAIAFSLSKISGLYAERVGMLFSVCPNSQYALDTTSFLNAIIREVNSSPAGWGQRIMAEVFKDRRLYRQWTEKNLPEMAKILQERRKILADALPKTIAPIAREGTGMFTVLPMSKEGIDFLREVYGIYVVPNGPGQMRVNIGGVTIKQMHHAVEAIQETYRKYPNISKGGE